LGKARVTGAAYAVVAAFAWSAPAGAGTAVNTGYFGGLAIEGYDPDAYFTEGRAIKGSEEFAYHWLAPPGTSPKPSIRSCSPSSR
jgi:hypothetical protein